MGNSSPPANAPKGAEVVASQGQPAPFIVNEIVDYYSTSQGAWIPATVLAVNPTGTLNLDCKADVPADKVRKKGTPDVSQYAVGDVVQYWSASQNGWILAKVLSVNPGGGTYNLDCKPNVALQSIRPAPPGAAEAAGSHAPATSAASHVTPPSGSFEPEQRRQWNTRQDARAAASSGLAKPLGGSLAVTPLKLEAPVQLLRVERAGSGWRYEVCPEGARILESQGSRRIAVASICGLYRTGKSYLLNLLLERVQKGLPLFQVGGTTRACTEGLWLWGSSDSDREGSPLIAFLDCEGFGSTDSDRSRDAQLMTLCCLLSSVLVLNTKGALNESLFNSLAMVCKFAEHVEERGNEASRPNLLWVLRDFVLELVDQSGQPISPDEYLEQALAAAPLASHDQARSQGAREVRQNLLKFFSRRSCSTLVVPIVDEEKLQRLQEVPYRDLRKEFQQGVDSLRAQLVATCNAEPKAVGGHALSCVAFVGLMRQLVQSVNENKVLSVKGAWESVQHSACIDLTDELRNSACGVLRSLGAGERILGGAQIPLSDGALQEVFRRQRRETKADFQRRAVGDEEVRREYWQELKEALVNEEAVVRQKNNHAADLQLMDALKSWQAWLSDESASAEAGERVAGEVATVMERMPSAPLCRTSRAALEAAARRLSAARAAHASAAASAASAVASAASAHTEVASASADQMNALKAQAEKAALESQQARDAHQDVQVQIESSQAELRDAKAQIEKLTADIANYRNREHDIKASERFATDKDASMRAELDQVRAESAKNASERTRLEEQVKLHNAEKRRLEDALDLERGKATGHHDTLAKERQTLQEETEKTRGEHRRMLDEAMQRSEADRKTHTETLENEKKRLLESERAAGELEGRVSALTVEKEALHKRVEELENQLRDNQTDKGRSKEEQDTLNRDVEKLKKEVDAKDEAARDEAAKRAALEQRLQEKQPKCGCIVQ